MAAGLVTAAQANALTIVANFDGSITSASNAVQIENSINKALQFYGENFSNPVTVNINFAVSNSPDVLGQSSTFIAFIPTTVYLDHLQAASLAHPENAVLQAALPFATAGNGATIANMFITTPLARSLGFSLGAFGPFDATITLGAAYINFGDIPSPTLEYFANSVIQHEVDEVLGTGGAGSGVGGSTMGAIDLYRYSAPGLGSFTTDPNVPAYFSLDGGTTNIIDFNRSGAGDAGDWAKLTCIGPAQVQDYRACPGVPMLGLTRSDVQVEALQAIGWNLLPAGVPEPATWVSMLLGFFGMGAALRSRRGTTAAA